MGREVRGAELDEPASDLLLFTREHRFPRHVVALHLELDLIFFACSSPPTSELKSYEAKEHENIHASRQNIPRTNLVDTPLLNLSFALSWCQAVATAPAIILPTTAFARRALVVTFDVTRELGFFLPRASVADLTSSPPIS